ncbi:MAG: apolipoprotein N-acyltransferase [Candidatus Midichloria sp.]|nr:MAG: apolipoprotein N-acyltransferase [Candidatus Midichloria sp.]
MRSSLKKVVNFFYYNTKSYYLFRIVCAFFSGALLTLAFAPFNFIYAVLFSFLSFIYLVEFSVQGKALKRFFIGFAYGMGHFLTSLYWISYSLLFEPEKFAWLIPFSVTLIPALISFFIGIFTIFVSYFMSKNGDRVLICLIFASGWIVTELIRSHAIFNFPWNLLGYTGVFSDYFVQITSIIGVSGMGFIIALAAVIPYTKKLLPIFITYSCIGLCFLYGYYRISGQQATADNDKIVKIRLIQPNFQQSHFGDDEKKLEFLLRLIEMSNENGYQDRDLIIWPESAYPFLINNNRGMFEVLGKVLKSDSALVFGADRYINQFKESYLFNSMVSISKDGHLVDYYNKKILVPFGEYMPLKKFLPALDKVVSGVSDFSKGDALNLLEVDKVGKIIPLICFEIAFDSLYNRELVKNALFVLNITNDLWFSDSIGPYQHFTMSKIRAIEYGLPLVRVANTGISTVIDCYGRILLICELNTAVVKDFNLRLTHAFSIYTQYKLKVVILALIGLIMAIASVTFLLKAKKY